MLGWLLLSVLRAVYLILDGREVWDRGFGGQLARAVLRLNNANSNLNLDARFSALFASISLYVQCIYLSFKILMTMLDGAEYDFKDG
jgi:hypothetical protein